jgi:CelD/BcsL family acetyltransferase involved in cellulose biosynthesis
VSEVAWIREVGELEALAGEWDALAARQAERSPFDLHCWYVSWWRAFGAGGELAVLTLRDGGELAGIFPLRRAGGQLLSLSNVHSPLYRPIARDREALAALVEAALAAAGGLELASLPEGDAATAQLREGAGGAGKLSLLERAHVSPTVDTSGDFDIWREQSKKRWGAPLERFRRKMGRDHEAELSIVEPPDDLEAELADGYRVEASGWKGEQGTAIVSKPETEIFYTEVARAFERRGELRFSRIRLDGETAAFDLTLLHDNRLHLLKTGFDERFRKLAPGLVMRLSIIERCFELGLASHELLGDESEWKAKFQTGVRPYATLRLYPRGPAGRARHAYRKTLRPRLRTVYRRLRRS